MKQFISLLIRFVPRKYLQLFSGAGLRMMGIFYIGHQVECPICRSQYRKFLPYGRIKPRPNALCPHCLSLERHRLIWLYLNRETNFFKTPLDVLHIAPERCFIKQFEAQHGDRYITADIESPLAKVKMDVHNIPFPEKSFDVVLCNHVLEHVNNDIKVMEEFRRVLRTGGFAILQVPFFNPVPETTIEDTSITDSRERERLFGQDDHVRKYGKDYSTRIAKSGLRPEASAFGANFSKEEAHRYGIEPREVLYVAKV